MPDDTPETASGTQAVPTPAEVVAAGQIPAQAPASIALGQQQAAAAQPVNESQPETDWEAEATKWKSLSRQHERQHLAALGFKSKDEIDQLRQAAEKYREHEDTQKSEIQRATERATGLEGQLADLQSANARLMAAATHNIPPDLIELLGSGTDEEINARAEALAGRLKATAPSPAPASQRPVESLTPGAAPSSGAPATADDWIRRMAGRTT
ncbi:hypothetical protein [Streptomyces sp. NPDC097640]|uniref:hypothetical protein n=1 Tax=Streptomyces sp. NPDC097640 TaxID=3157229 RepID=UPI003316DA2B